MMEDPGTSETLISYQTAPRNIQEDSHLKNLTVLWKLLILRRLQVYFLILLVTKPVTWMFQSNVYLLKRALTSMQIYYVVRYSLMIKEVE